MPIRKSGGSIWLMWSIQLILFSVISSWTVYVLVIQFLYICIWLEVVTFAKTNLSKFVFYLIVACSLSVALFSFLSTFPLLPSVYKFLRKIVKPRNKCGISKSGSSSCITCATFLQRADSEYLTKQAGGERAPVCYYVFHINNFRVDFLMSTCSFLFHYCIVGQSNKREYLTFVCIAFLRLTYVYASAFLR